MATAFNVGDRVKMARSFLKSIKAPGTDPMWFARGTVVAVKKLGGGFPALVKVLWDGEDEPKGSLAHNLAGERALEIER